MISPPLFAPTRAAALAALALVDPVAYARTRNALDGAVTRLSPYLTHGVLSLPQVYAAVHAHKPLEPAHKLVFEWGWRAYYRHVWAHLGNGITQSLHQGVLPDDAYQPDMPADVQEARTGIPAIDLAVRELYATGYVHNHARMWLASYLVHLRKVHWSTGADWMLAHLLDGDLASNHLSWQWVAGTGSTKPYLFNADNVAKYAPPDWHSGGTVLDTSYEALGHIAQSPEPVAHGRDVGLDGFAQEVGAGVAVPALHTTPQSADWRVLDGSSGANEADVAGRDVFLLHPWSLGAQSRVADDAVWYTGVAFKETHHNMPWSEHRWRFVTDGLRERTSQLWFGDVTQVAQALRNARSVHWQAEPHIDAQLQALQMLLGREQGARNVVAHTPENLFAPVESYCPSFSQWWRQTRLVV